MEHAGRVSLPANLLEVGVNGDGVQDATNEPGIIGATVQLTYAGQDGDLSTCATDDPAEK